MKIKNKKTGIAIMMAAMTMMAAGCSATGSQKGNSASGNTIKVGVNMELSGAAAGYGQQEENGIKLAVHDINKNGGIKVNGKKMKIKIITRDNKTSTSTAASVASQLTTKDKVVATVGPATTNAATAAIPNQTKAQVPLVSPTAADPSFTRTKKGSVQKYVFRAQAQNNYQGQVAANFANTHLKAKRVAILADNSSDYGTGLAKAFKKNFKGTIVSTQYFQEGDKDFSSLITAIKNKKIDAIYVPGYYSEVGVIIKQAREAGINAPIIGSGGMADPKLAKIAGASNATNVYYTTPFSTITAKNNAEARKFMKEYKAKYGQTAPTYSALGYDATMMVTNAIKKADSTNSNKITDALAKTKNMKGVTGTITVNKKHDPQMKMSVEQMTNGKVTNGYTVK